MIPFCDDGMGLNLSPEKKPTKRVIDFLKTVGWVIGIIYVMISLIASVYFEYDLATKWSFLEWLFFGSWWALIKGFLWPFFVFF